VRAAYRGAFKLTQHHGQFVTLLTRLRTKVREKMGKSLEDYLEHLTLIDLSEMTGRDCAKGRKALVWQLRYLLVKSTSS
jgi:hypothetical protein